MCLKMNKQHEHLTCNTRSEIINYTLAGLKSYRFKILNKHIQVSDRMRKLIGQEWKELWSL